MSIESNLPSVLRQLSLTTLVHHWEAQALEAEKQHWRYGQYLYALSELELQARYTKRIQRHVKESQLPAGKTLSTFNFAMTPSVNPAQIQALAESIAWTQQAGNLLLFGASGVGKTHLAAAIGYCLIEQDVRVFFSSTTSLVQKLQQAKAEFKLPQALKKFERYPVLILDDIGYVKKDSMETCVLFELIAERYESGSLIITANQPFSEWDKIFPDSMMTVAAVDRLIHHATIININEKSYRQSDAAKRTSKPIKEEIITKK